MSMISASRSLGARLFTKALGASIERLLHRHRWELMTCDVVYDEEGDQAGRRYVSRCSGCPKTRARTYRL